MALRYDHLFRYHLVRCALVVLPSLHLALGTPSTAAGVEPQSTGGADRATTSGNVGGFPHSSSDSSFVELSTQTATPTGEGPPTEEKKEERKRKMDWRKMSVKELRRLGKKQLQEHTEQVLQDMPTLQGDDAEGKAKSQKLLLNILTAYAYKTTSEPVDRSPAEAESDAEAEEGAGNFDSEVVAKIAAAIGKIKTETELSGGGMDALFKETNGSKGAIRLAEMLKDILGDQGPTPRTPRDDPDQVLLDFAKSMEREAEAQRGRHESEVVAETGAAERVKKGDRHLEGRAEKRRQRMRKLREKAESLYKAMHPKQPVDPVDKDFTEMQRKLFNADSRRKAFPEIAALDAKRRAFVEEQRGYGSIFRDSLAAVQKGENAALNDINAQRRAEYSIKRGLHAVREILKKRLDMNQLYDMNREVLETSIMPRHDLIARSLSMRTPDFEQFTNLWWDKWGEEITIWQKTQAVWQSMSARGPLEGEQFVRRILDPRSTLQKQAANGVTPTTAPNKAVTNYKKGAASSSLQVRWEGGAPSPAASNRAGGSSSLQTAATSDFGGADPSPPPDASALQQASATGPGASAGVADTMTNEEVKQGLGKYKEASALDYWPVKQKVIDRDVKPVQKSEVREEQKRYVWVPCEEGKEINDGCYFRRDMGDQSLDATDEKDVVEAEKRQHKAAEELAKEQEPHEPPPPATEPLADKIDQRTRKLKEETLKLRKKSARLWPPYREKDKIIPQVVAEKEEKGFFASLFLEQNQKAATGPPSGNEDLDQDPEAGATTGAAADAATAGPATVTASTASSSPPGGHCRIPLRSETLRPILLSIYTKFADIKGLGFSESLTDAPYTFQLRQPSEKDWSSPFSGRYELVNMLQLFGLPVWRRKEEPRFALFSTNYDNDNGKWVIAKDMPASEQEAAAYRGEDISAADAAKTDKPEEENKPAAVMMKTPEAFSVAHEGDFPTELASARWTSPVDKKKRLISIVELHKQDEVLPSLDILLDSRTPVNERRTFLARTVAQGYKAELRQERADGSLDPVPPTKIWDKAILKDLEDEGDEANRENDEDIKRHVKNGYIAEEIDAKTGKHVTDGPEAQTSPASNTGNPSTGSAPSTNESPAPPASSSLDIGSAGGVLREGRRVTPMNLDDDPGPEADEDEQQDSAVARLPAAVQQQLRRAWAAAKAAPAPARRAPTTSPGGGRNSFVEVSSNLLESQAVSKRGRRSHRHWRYSILMQNPGNMGDQVVLSPRLIEAVLGVGPGLPRFYNLGRKLLYELNTRDDCFLMFSDLMRLHRQHKLAMFNLAPDAIKNGELCVGEGDECPDPAISHKSELRGFNPVMPDEHELAGSKTAFDVDAVEKIRQSGDPRNVANPYARYIEDLPWPQ